MDQLAKDTGETADTGGCPSALGGGCGPPPTPPACVSDTGALVDSGQAFSAIEGGGCGCTVSSVVGGLPSVWLALLVGLLRRGAWVVLLVVARPALALDVDLLHVGDGGAFVSLLDTNPGPAWTPRVALTAGVVHDPVLVQDGGVVTSLVDDVQKAEAGVAVPLGDHLRVAASVPYIWSMEWAGSGQPPMVGVPRGAMSVHTADRATRQAWEVEVTSNRASTEAARVLLADPGAIGVTWAFSREQGPVVLAGEVGASMRGETELPGVTVAQQGHFGAGVSWRPWERVPTSLELFGRTPMASGTGRVGWPAEVLASVGRQSRSGWEVRGAGGMGVTKGVGSANWRALLMVQRTPGLHGDRDGDGIADLRDLCRREPEDPDGFRDGDGCPDEDNDQDGIVDYADGCPDEPETFNGHADRDGCADELVVVTARVRLALLQADAQAWLRVTGDGREAEKVVLHDEPVELRLPDGMWTLTAGAPGHADAHTRVAVARSGRRNVVLELVPQPMGTLVLRVDDDQTGEPVAAQVELSPMDCPRDAEGGVVDLPAGTELVVDRPACGWAVDVRAEGFVDASEVVELGADVQVALTVRLQRQSVHTRGSEVKLGGPLRFDHNSAALPPGSAERLDALARWLTARSDVDLLRVEGRADELGGAAYNLALSTARAKAVTRALVARGVDADRLQPLGSGEAFAGGQVVADGLDRQVRFVLLVWDRQAEESPPGL